MTVVYHVLRQDFAAATAAFGNTDFHNMNICANRLMSNVIFGESNEKHFMAPGYFLRIIANDFIALKDDAIAKAFRQPAEHFVAAIDRGFNESLDLTMIWNGFFDYTERKREYLTNVFERKIYSDNRTFTARAVKYLTDRFFNDPFLTTEDGILLKAFLVETDRLIRNHGAENKELVLYSLMRALDWIDRYVAIAVAETAKSGNTDAPKNQLLPYLNRIQTWYSESEETPYNNATEILCDILLKWRLYYLRYLERTKPSPEEERRVELPGQVRQRIGATIAQALQKDIVDKDQKRKRK